MNSSQETDAMLPPEDEEPEIVSPFMNSTLDLGSQSLPIPDFSEENPVSAQVAALGDQAFAPVSASLLHRIVAKLMDWFLTGILYYGLVTVWVLRLPIEERSAALSIALFFGISGAWFTWFLYNLFLKGNTLGKRAFGLQVLTEQGQRMSWGRNFGRVWGESLSWGFCFVGYLFALFDADRRALHDHLCGTRVVVRQPH